MLIMEPLEAPESRPHRVGGAPIRELGDDRRKRKFPDPESAIEIGCTSARNHESLARGERAKWCDGRINCGA
jgi:hypothetical protein